MRSVNTHVLALTTWSHSHRGFRRGVCFGREHRVGLPSSSGQPHPGCHPPRCLGRTPRPPTVHKARVWKPSRQLGSGMTRSGPARPRMRFRMAGPRRRARRPDIRRLPWGEAAGDARAAGQTLSLTPTACSVHSRTPGSGRSRTEREQSRQLEERAPALALRFLRCRGGSL